MSPEYAAIQAFTLPFLLGTLHFLPPWLSWDRGTGCGLFNWFMLVVLPEDSRALSGRREMGEPAASPADLGMAACPGGEVDHV